MPVSEILPRQRRYVAVPNPLLQEVEALVIFAPRVRFDAAIGRVLVAPVAVDQAADRPAERRGRRSARDPFPQFRSMDPRLRLRLVCVVGQPARLDLVAGGMARHTPRNPIEAVGTIRPADALKPVTHVNSSSHLWPPAASAPDGASMPSCRSSHALTADQRRRFANLGSRFGSPARSRPGACFSQ